MQARWTNLATIVLATSAVAAPASELPPIEPAPSIMARIHWIQFNMVSGRIASTSGLSVSKMLVQSPGRRTNRRESLAIEINAGVCGMEYWLQTADDDLRIVLAAGDRLLVRRARPEDHYLLEFEQAPERPLKLVLHQRGVERRWEAAGLWQLYLAEPASVREHLIPLLELLHPSWQLAAAATAIEDALAQLPPSHALASHDRRQWASWVAALASGRFAERETAHRALLRAGQAVVPYLQTLDSAQLDAEQMARVRAIVTALSVDYEDRVERVASWLAHDEQAWLALLERDDIARRRAAVEHLSRLWGERIDFDPEAAPELRAEQLARLRARAGSNATAPHAK